LAANGGLTVGASAALSGVATMSATAQNMDMGMVPPAGVSMAAAVPPAGVARVVG
jgi:hypothetical protein